MTDRSYIQNLRVPSKEQPLKILMSACLTGITCGFDGSANGEYPSALKLLNYNNVKIVKFCPEEFSFGTPREMCDIHGGTSGAHRDPRPGREGPPPPQNRVPTGKGECPFF